MTYSASNDPEWFNRENWKENWNVQPNESIDKEEFIKQYARNPERWARAFRFLAESDLKNLPIGKYELEGTDLYVSISEYITKDEENAKYEAHNKYVDIQYVISGKERMSLVPLADTQDATPYNAEKDIYFMQANYDNYFQATPENFFIFFPSDAHRPGVKSGDNTPVRKAVVKLKID